MTTQFLAGFMIGLGSFVVGATIGYYMLKNKKVEKVVDRYLSKIGL